MFGTFGPPQPSRISNACGHEIGGQMNFFCSPISLVPSIIYVWMADWSVNPFFSSPQHSHGFNHRSGPAEVKAMSAGVTMADHDDGVIGVTKLSLGDRVDLFVATCSRAIINTHINCLIPSSCSSGSYKSVVCAWLITYSQQAFVSHHDLP